MGTLITRSKNQPNKDEKKITFKTYISYALGDTGDNIMFSTVSSLLTLFYTDYIGLPASSVAFVMLISRFLDGISDFIAGIIMSKTKSKYGVCRPWVLWISVPFSISCVACFAVPQGSQIMKIVYIFIAYNFANTICYTISNLSQATLCSYMSRDTKEREKLGIWRLGLAPVGHIISSGLSLPLVKMLGNNQAAWLKVMTVWAIYALIVHIICFLNCEEQVHIEAAVKSSIPLKKQLKALFSNQYWWWAIFFWIFWATTFGVNGTTMSYYAKYILNSDTLYSSLFIVEKLFWGVSILSMLVIRKAGLKRRTLLIMGSVLIIAGQLLLLAAPYSVPVNYLVVIIRGLGQGPSSAFFNGMVADVIEFGQWKTHQRQETLVFAASSLGQKIGGGLILSLITAIIGASGFVSSTSGGAIQPDSALAAIKTLYIWGPIVMYAAIGIISSLNRLDEKLPAIMAELTRREAKGEL